MTNHNLPPNVYNPMVHIGDANVEALYAEQIRSLNAIAMTPVLAAKKLSSMGYMPEAWDRWVAQGVLEDTNHEARALIGIARGDERGLGDIYDEIRRVGCDPIGQDEVNKAVVAARRYDPLADSTKHYF